MFVGETLGRDAQAKAARQFSSKDTDRALQKLLKRDRDGSKVLKAARDFGKKMEKKAQEEAGDGKGAKQRAEGKGKGAVKKRKRDENESDFSDDDADSSKRVAKNAFSASLVKNLGFDPTAKDGKKIQDTEVQRKVSSSLSICLFVK